jgi:hypothetical protein
MASVAVTYDPSLPGPGPVSPWSFLRLLPAPQQEVVARLRQSAPLLPIDECSEGRADPFRARYVISLLTGRRRCVPMRLEIEAWSSGTSRAELVPLRRVRPGRRYLKAGHRFLDALTATIVGG